MKSFLLAVVGVAVLMSVIGYAEIRWSFGWYARRSLKDTAGA